ncbi:hypothetical protein OZX60_06785 [Streptococcaceae bacterium ESL0687]|nr:hypothetical protein OZX60_06785 [Streptococcaceae bacterium ESL0687]
MNAKKLLGLGLASAVLLGSGVATAFAADVDHEVQTQTGTTPVTVQVNDESDPDPINPVTPTDPTSPVLPGQTRLTLNHVPTAYDFQTTVSDGQYTVNSGTIGSGTAGDGSEDIVVFNSKVGRKWNVKATVANEQLSITKSGTTTNFPVTSFKITSTGANGNGSAQEVSATGYQGVVAQDVNAASGATLDAENNTSSMSIPVSAVSIGFTDNTHVIKAGDTVTGTIDYQLYMVTTV